MLSFEYETVNTINVDEIQKMKKLLNTSSDFVAGKIHWTYLLTPQLMTEIACNCGVLYDMKSTKYNPFFIAILYLLFNNLVYEKNEGDFFNMIRRRDYGMQLRRKFSLPRSNILSWN